MAPLGLVGEVTAAWPVIKIDHTPASRDGPLVAILLCTYQGAAFLAEQLDSIARQTHTNWTVWVSDDGSTDATLQIVSTYRAQWGNDRLSIVRGPSAGPAYNFLTLTSLPDVQGEFFAWSDQDDIWEPQKLERALAWLARSDAHKPMLYGSRTLLTDASGKSIGLSPLFTKPPAFANAVVQNIAGGNTMVFNSAARALLVNAGPDPRTVAHDWWAYLLVTACGGRMHYDPVPSIRYRQHGDNLVGSVTHPLRRLPRLRTLLRGQFKSWIDLNLELLGPVRAQMSAENVITLDRFALARQRRLPARMLALWRSGVYRQTWPGNFGLALAALLNRL